MTVLHDGITGDTVGNTAEGITGNTAGDTTRPLRMAAMPLVKVGQYRWSISQHWRLQAV